MGVTVSLCSVVGELEGLVEEWTLYLNRETGELYSLPDEHASMIEDGADPDELPDWLEDDVPKIREILESETWLALPTTFGVHEWAIMDDFARSLEDPALSDEVREAIRGRGAFRMFRATIERHGIRDEWDRFRVRVMADIAADWLEANGVAYDRDMGADSG